MHIENQFVRQSLKEFIRNLKIRFHQKFLDYESLVFPIGFGIEPAYQTIAVQNGMNEIPVFSFSRRDIAFKRIIEIE